MAPAKPISTVFFPRAKATSRRIGSLKGASAFAGGSKHERGLCEAGIRQRQDGKSSPAVEWKVEDVSVSNHASAAMNTRVPEIETNSKNEADGGSVGFGRSMVMGV
jgi:hypothetical protein